MHKWISRCSFRPNYFPTNCNKTIPINVQNFFKLETSDINPRSYFINFSSNALLSHYFHSYLDFKITCETLSILPLRPQKFLLLFFSLFLSSISTLPSFVFLGFGLNGNHLSRGSGCLGYVTELSTHAR